MQSNRHPCYMMDTYDSWSKIFRLLKAFDFHPSLFLLLVLGLFLVLFGLVELNFIGPLFFWLLKVIKRHNSNIEAFKLVFHSMIQLAITS